MRVFVKVRGAETFQVHTVRSQAELERLLDFARIGSARGAPRVVYRIDQAGRRFLIARYVDGRSRTTSLMRARRHLALWGFAHSVGLEALRRLFGR